MKKVSVCVPTYNRPDMVRQLIHSFLNQRYDNKELIIADDSSNDETKEMSAGFHDSRIKYYKNKVNLGYAKNFLMAMMKADGDYIVMLGDDDLFLDPFALSRYVEVFNNHPEVSYVYSNQVQFSNRLQVEYIYPYFANSRRFACGEEAMKGIWTSSIFIPGIGIRNNFDLESLYPKKDVLFPQLEFVGNIVNLHDAFGIAEYLIAGRAHEEQLGFYAIKGERIKGGEKHGTVELFTIFRYLQHKYGFEFNDDFLARDLVNRFLVTMLKEKSIVGSRRVRYNYHQFCRVSTIAGESKKLKLSYIIAVITPSILIRQMRQLAIVYVRYRQHRRITQFEQQLRKMATLS